MRAELDNVKRHRATAAETRSAAPPKAAGNIDALLALQGVEDPIERLQALRTFANQATAALRAARGVQRLGGVPRPAVAVSALSR